MQLPVFLTLPPLDLLQLFFHSSLNPLIHSEPSCLAYFPPLIFKYRCLQSFCSYASSHFTYSPWMISATISSLTFLIIVSSCSQCADASWALPYLFKYLLDIDMRRSPNQIILFPLKYVPRPRI